MISASRWRVPARFLILGVVAVAALVVGASGSSYLPMASPTAKPSAVTPTKSTATAQPSDEPTTASDRPFADDPPPPLLSKSKLANAIKLVDAQRAPADTAIQRWWVTQGTGIADDAFTKWALQQIPAAGTEFARSQELAQLKTVTISRSATDVKAARWLERHADADVWALLRQEQLALRSGDTQPSMKELELVTRLASTIAKGYSDTAKRPAPYVLDPTLKDDQKAAKSPTECPCSYPSEAPARGAAARTYLGALVPHRLDEYRWFEAQIATGEFLRGEALPSDISASAFIGDLVGRYVLVTRGYAKP